MILRTVLVTLMGATALANAPAPLQYSFTLWNWEKGYRDMAFFRNQVDACRAAGFTLIELGAGWPDCEPEPGVFDFSLVDKRVDYIRDRNMDIRLRVDVSHWPKWFEPEKFENPDGSAFLPNRGYPSVFSEENRTRQMRFVAELAEHFAGRGFTYTPGFSVHMEVKFAAWNSYEPSARGAFHQWLAGRYGSLAGLNDAWGTEYAYVTEIEPPVPDATHGDPDLNPVVHDWIAFREQALTDWVRAFAATVRSNDPSARISVPLGESYRREAAAFANLDYWGYSRKADEIVHSYDFFWHGPQGIAQVQTAVATMSGITQRPVILEIDGPYAIEHYGYTTEDYRKIGNLALSARAAGVQVTNWGSVNVSTQPWMRELGNDLKKHTGGAETSDEPKVLYFVSKWANYCFRESDEWLYDRQFGLFTSLRAAGIPARIVTDENLISENLSGDVLVIPFAPLVAAPVRDRIRALSYGMRTVATDPVGVYTCVAKTAGQFGAKIERLDGGWPTDPSGLKAMLLNKNGARKLRVAAVQFHTKFNVTANTGRIIAYLHKAAENHVDVVAFTEMALTGYSKRREFGDTIDWVEIDEAIERIKTACRELSIYAVVGAPTRDRDAIFCSAVTIAPTGEIIDAYEKTYLAGEQWATPGCKLTVFPIEGTKCGSFICHDERYAHLVQLRALAGAQLFFCISCESGPGDEHKIEPYRAQIQARAVENGVYIVHANAPARLDDLAAGDASHGQSRIVAPDGNLLVEASVDGEEMIVADIDLRYARDAGMPAALTSGSTAEWMRQGVELVTGR